jgi:hypothetical protein
MDIPTIEPTVIAAGTTVRWTKDISADYNPVLGWSLAYFINGPVATAITASVTGSLFSVTIAASTTAGWMAGIYSWESRASLSGESYVVGSGSFTVKADASQLENGYDPRTPAKRILDAHMAAYETYAGRIEKQYSINSAGRSFVYEDKAALISAIQFWQSTVLAEEQSEKIARGENSGRNILVRFK